MGLRSRKRLSLGEMSALKRMRRIPARSEFRAEEKPKTENMPIGALIASLGATALSSGSQGLFSGVSLRSREERKAARRKRREARKKRRQTRRGTVSIPTIPDVGGGQTPTGNGGSPDEARGFDMDKLMEWLKENWYIPVGAAALLFLLFAFKKKNKAVRRRRTAPARAARSGSTTRRKSNPHGRKRSKADIKAERLRNLAKARRAKKAKSRR